MFRNVVLFCLGGVTFIAISIGTLVVGQQINHFYYPPAPRARLFDGHRLRAIGNRIENGPRLLQPRRG